jgi:hypothetical protein
MAAIEFNLANFDINTDSDVGLAEYDINLVDPDISL